MCLRRILIVSTAVILLIAATSNAADATSSPSPDDCGSWPRMHALDFWLGTWTVSSQGQVVGTNRIEAILKGCAVMEHWRDVEGGEGQSVFYYDRANDRWKQLWLTDRAFRRGGTKEKVEIREETSSDRIRFQGDYPDPESGVTIKDRTTLSRQADGTVRQVIEVSTDAGKSWRTTFEGMYRSQSK